ncbi:hypothetical protein [Orientia tsutsugamushi]|uniref:Uncharacterized protein n=1 Tax=Orientia tsutsugamushi TaxID=784 RepID=A0A2U3RPJ7_ORITS|nr:hypothetical protein [Orientia tsutsugamushi]KJV50994.1 hypothetical protein OTSKARP_1541 [Orientia tsutsugamushi str. Karp]SPR15176.1 Uncharacterised protein [Orientia tsutsugamushi]
MPLGYQIILSANNQDCNVRSMIIPCQTLKIEDRDVDKVPNIPYDTTDLQSSSSSHTEYIPSFSIDNMFISQLSRFNEIRCLNISDIQLYLAGFNILSKYCNNNLTSLTLVNDQIGLNKIFYDRGVKQYISPTSNHSIRNPIKKLLINLPNISKLNIGNNSISHVAIKQILDCINESNKLNITLDVSYNMQESSCISIKPFIYHLKQDSYSLWMDSMSNFMKCGGTLIVEPDALVCHIHQETLTSNSGPGICIDMHFSDLQIFYKKNIDGTIIIKRFIPHSSQLKIQEDNNSFSKKELCIDNHNSDCTYTASTSSIMQKSDDDLISECFANNPNIKEQINNILSETEINNMLATAGATSELDINISEDYLSYSDKQIANNDAIQSSFKRKREDIYTEFSNKKANFSLEESQILDLVNQHSSLSSDYNISLYDSDNKNLHYEYNC